MSKIYCVAINNEGIRRGLKAECKFFTNEEKAQAMVEEYTISEDRVQISRFVNDAIVREILPMEWLELGEEMPEDAIVEIISYDIMQANITSFTAID